MNEKKIIYVLLILLTACSSPQRQSLPTPTSIDYPDVLEIKISGTPENPLVYDGRGQTVKCISITGNNVIVRNFIVSGCESHGIYVDSKNVIIENNTVTNAESDMLNSTKTGCIISSGINWGSGIKVRVGGENIIIRNNTVYENCGEGIAVTRGVNVKVEDNIVRDNLSVNIYIDNSNFTVTQNNQVSCTGIFLREGRRPSGIVSAEEDYGVAWGAQRHDNQILNNIISNCFHGIGSGESELDNGKEINLLIDGNIATNCIGSINCIKLDTVNINVVVSNNCVDSNQRIWVRYSAGVTLFNNVCGTTRTLTPTFSISTLTPTFITPSATFPPATITPTRTATPSRTPTRTPTITKTSTPTLIIPTNTPIPTCEVVYENEEVLITKCKK